MTVREILRALLEKADAREWRIIDQNDDLEIYANDIWVASMRGGLRAGNADLVVWIRNGLPELLRSMDTADWYIEYWKKRALAAEEKLEERRLDDLDRQYERNTRED